ncbi:MAG: DUF5723 family protein [Flavobacteriales bacterium]|nr:DUF5723 family protein [Flavobacteriales bacterium]
MRALSRILTVVTLILGLTGIVSAQDFAGYSIGSWAGINSLHMNPANVVDSRYKVDINLFMLNVSGGNNFVSINQNAIFNPSRFDEPGADTTYIKYNWNGAEKNGIINLRVQGPSFMFNITQKDAIAFTSNLRVVADLDNLNEDFADFIINGIPSSKYGINYKEDFASGNANIWAEYGITYGRVILDKEEHFLKAGITLKFLQGLASAYGGGRDIDFVWGHDTIRKMVGNVIYGHSDNLDFNNGNYTFKLEGVGFSADFGVVYEWRPKWQKYKYDMDGKTNLWRKDLDKYTLKASLALVDAGAIQYTRAANSRDYIANVYGLPNSYFDGIESIYDLTDKLNNMPGMTVKDMGQKTYGHETPISLIASLDYQVVKGFYLNFTPFIAFNNGRTDNSRSHVATNLAFTIRYENPWFGAYMPIAYNTASDFNWGLALRLGPLNIGSGDLFSNLIEGDWKGIDIHAGLKIPIPHGKPRDRDNDKVSDRLDKCREIPGVWAFKGCPDTDGDGIQDSEDECPTEPGLAEFRGCPDTDGDGLPDKIDKCPTEAGPKELEGCPDRDGDGIIDREDECPDEKGLAEFKGCPDTEGDGLIDKLDNCPTIPGPKETFGCPDTDGDGILDHEDLCPTVPGVAELKGCPYADTDGDGIRDIDDKCPTVPGVIENFGCPPLTEKEKEVVKKAFDNLEFATGKSIIRTSSYSSLDELAALMKEKPEWRLLIEGHTDNVGKHESNITLSKNRSNAVKNYLVKKGVATSRFVVNWYGPDKPIDTNDTEEGRQRNRRVEMTLIQ